MGYPPPGCGDGGDCLDTYAVKGKCYDKSEINYLLFGLLSRLCSYSTLKSNLMIAGHKVYVKTYFQLTGPEKLEWEYTKQVLGWFKVGRLYAGSFNDPPKEKEKHSSCGKCPENPSKFSEDLGTTWP